MKFKIGLVSMLALLLLFTSQPAISASCEIQYSNLSDLKKMQQRNARWHQRKVMSDKQHNALKQQINRCIEQWKELHLRSSL